MNIKKILVFLLVAVISVTAFMVPASAATTKIEPVDFIVTKEIGKTYVKLSWDKVDGANKYAVYYSTKYNGEYKKYGNVSKTSVTLKNLKKNTRYYVKIKSLKTTNGKTFSSKYSDAIMFRTRNNAVPKELVLDGTMAKDGTYNLLINDLYIRITPSFSIVSKVENRFSEHNGQKVVGLFAEIYNYSGKTTHLNSFDVTSFSPSGKELDNLRYFFDFGDYIYNDILPDKGTAGLFIIPFSKVGQYTLKFDGGYKEDDILVKLDIDTRVLTESGTQQSVSEWLDEIIEDIN